MRGIERNAIDWTHLLALRLIKMADAFGAFIRIDDVDFRALRNGFVRTFGFAYITVDAGVGDD